MRHFLKIMIAFVLIASMVNVNAQMKADSSKKTKASSDQNQEYASMEKGKLIEYTNNEWGYLTDDFICTNGAKVSQNGTFTKADGSTIKLNEGDKVYRDGHMTSASRTTSSKSGKPLK
jgi:hypothetical protein